MKAKTNKAKSRKSVLKRIKVSGTGKILRRMAFGRHLRSTKSEKQKRRYKHQVVVTNSKVARRIKRMLAIA